jgi:hypothetical protein
LLTETVEAAALGLADYDFLSKQNELMLPSKVHYFGTVLQEALPTILLPNA